ncbi:MAG TPA: phytanoyl-CoA dioxygenase family protein [Polyangiaceae bacterium]|jgi:ectoine hydroxylase-related dioxygenase (phytanoyl-CoA dioxygenase family)|nr:phytanoyl-CoA dioxygenase family protein [Polyangiaceae bacterium]
MPPSQAQIARFHAQGYLAIPHFFSQQEVFAMRGELERLARDRVFRNVSTAGDGVTLAESKQNLQICPLHPQSKLFRALQFHPQVLDVVEALIGGPLVLHLDQTFLKPARTGQGTSWHQDNAYFQIADPFLGCAMWIAVHDACVENGTMEVIPGVARRKFEHSRDPMSDHHIRCYPDESKAEPIELDAGGVLFFCYGVPHCTRENKSNRDRASVAYHFMNQALYTPELLKGNAPVGTYLTGPQSSGGLSEYGERVAGSWAELVQGFASVRSASLTALF